MTKPSTAFIILNYRSHEMTLKLVKRLNSFGHKKNVFVVDNASQDVSASIFTECDAQGLCTFVQSPVNAGYAAGNNVGLRMAHEQGYAFALVLNNDIFIHDNETIVAMEELLAHDLRIAGVSPCIVNPDGTAITPYLYRPGVWDMSFGIFAFYKKMKKEARQKDTFLVYRLQGSCMMLRLSAMEQVGYMDERTFLYFEEPILAERLRAANFTLQCTNRVKVRHDHSVVTKRNLKRLQMLKIYAHSCNIYLKAYRKFRLPSRLLCTAVLCLSILRHWI